MKKKGIATLLAVSMMLAAVGCGTETSESTSVPKESSANTDNGESQAEAEGSAAEVDLSENITISVWEQADDYEYYQNYSDNPVVDWWSKKYNMTLEFQQPAMGSESSQFTLMLGTGDYTDFMDLGFAQDSTDALYADGVIQDLTPYVEQYMPNYLAFVNAEGNEDVKATVYDDNGRIFIIPFVEEQEPLQWGGLMYRRDILETMTGGNIAFPSGEDHPATVEDWDYMLPLMKAYFDASGMEDTACLIIPAAGYFQMGNLISGFGIGGMTYVKKDGSIGYGPAEPEMFNYLKKMNEWYEAGYIYKDFASRTSDPFYLPNTALTYSGKAGIWYGIAGQLNDKLSMPDYGLYVDVRAINSPLDAEHGITEETGGSGYMYTGRLTAKSGWAASTSCDEEKLVRMLAALDYFFTTEGKLIRSGGLSTAENVQDYPMYAEAGLPNGFREPNSEEYVWTEEGNTVNLDPNNFCGLRLPGLHSFFPTRTKDLVDGEDQTRVADKVWTKYGHDMVYPQVTHTAEESARNGSLGTQISDYVNSMVPQFITGQAELTEESFQAFVEQLNSLGLEEYLEIKSAAYERYLNRMK